MKQYSFNSSEVGGQPSEVALADIQSNPFYNDAMALVVGHEFALAADGVKSDGIIDFGRVVGSLADAALQQQQKEYVEDRTRDIF